MLQVTRVSVPSSPADESSLRYPGWRVVAVCFVMAMFCWGFGFYGHGVYLAELQRLFGWPAALISGASTAYYFASAVLVVFVSDAMTRFGPRRVALAGVTCLAAATGLIAIIASPWQVYAAYLVMAFGWAAMSLAAITNILGLWFDRKRGLAISLALNGASVSGIVIVPALVAGTAAVGFANAMLIATAVMLAVLVPLIVAWLDRPPAVVPGRPAQAAASASWTRASALRSLTFWTASGPFALALTAQVGFIVHQISFLEPMVGRHQAGLAVALTTIMAVVGRVGLGTFIDRFDPRAGTAASLASQVAALAVMTQTTDAAILLAACALFGFSVGNLITFPALIIQREFEPGSFGLLMGLSTAIGQFTYAFGPGLLGLVRDVTGGYAAPLVLCMVLQIAAAAIVLVRGRP